MSAGETTSFESRLYACRVLHERLEPKVHRFAYRAFYLAVDLDELGALHRRHRLFSVNGRNLFSLREDDYLPSGEPVHNPSRPAPASAPWASLKQRVTAYCRSRGIELGGQPRVVLVTLPRIFGYAFNPVSFFVCFDSNGAPACAIAEVTNTYREMKPYLLKPLGGTGRTAAFGARVAKHFYVSPFSDVDVAFDFRVQAPDRTLAVRIDDYAGGRRTLHSTLTGEAAALTDARLAWWLVRYPLLTLRVIVLIHWQALRLWLKRVPHFPKAGRAALQRDLVRPHGSLSNHTSA